MVSNRYIIYNNYTWNLLEPDHIMMILKTIHNAGFFSCCSIRLLDIMVYFNEHRGLPHIVDSSDQFMHYKGYPGENLIPYYFMESNDSHIPYSRRMEMTFATEEPQFSDYKKICFEDTLPFVYKFFTPSETVGNFSYYLREKYNIDYDNTCAVFYRGNDKNRETSIASYNIFIDKAKEIKQQNPGIKFLVQPDEGKFLMEFYRHFPEDTIWFTETPYTDNRDSCMVFELPQPQRKEYGAKFFAAVLCLSRCKHLITHSGNGSFWSVLYRGNTDNVYQWLNDKWL